MYNLDRYLTAIFSLWRIFAGISSSLQEMFFDVWANYNVITNAWRKFKSCSRHYKARATQVSWAFLDCSSNFQSAEQGDLPQVWCKLAVYVLGGNLTKMSAFRESLALLWYFLMINFCWARGKVLFMFFNYKESLRTKQWLPIYDFPTDFSVLFCSKLFPP